MKQEENPSKQALQPFLVENEMIEADVASANHHQRHHQHNHHHQNQPGLQNQKRNSQFIPTPLYRIPGACILPYPIYPIDNNFAQIAAFHQQQINAALLSVPHQKSLYLPKNPESGIKVESVTSKRREHKRSTSANNDTKTKAKKLSQKEAKGHKRSQSWSGNPKKYSSELDPDLGLIPWTPNPQQTLVRERQLCILRERLQARIAAREAAREAVRKLVQTNSETRKAPTKFENDAFSLQDSTMNSEEIKTEIFSPTSNDLLLRQSLDTISLSNLANEMAVEAMLSAEEELNSSHKMRHDLSASTSSSSSVIPSSPGYNTFSPSPMDTTSTCWCGGTTESGCTHSLEFENGEDVSFGINPTMINKFC